MGTRADFYVGRGESAEWIGSVAFDGYPDGTGIERICAAQSEKQFRDAVADRLKLRDDATVPADGWPWPWADSRTMDYAYAFDAGKVWASPCGRGWFDPLAPELDDLPESKTAIFPDMTDKTNIAFGKRSGMIIVQGI